MSRVNLRTAAIVALLACVAIVASPAPALASWGFHNSFGEGDLETPIGVAVDETGSSHVEAGAIYVGNFFLREIDEFSDTDMLVVPPSPFGEASFSGVAVNPVSHDVYVVNAKKKTVEVFDPSNGKEAYSFPIPGTGNLFGGALTAVQIASDAHGNVYVPDAPGNTIEVFNEKGEALPGINGNEGSGKEEHQLKKPEGVAISPTGDVWVADTEDNRIEEFEPSGKFVAEITVGTDGVQALAVDAAGDVFASIGGAKPHVVEYGPTGAPIVGAEKIGEGLLDEGAYGELNGIAVDSAREVLYVANGGGNVMERFANWVVSTDSPSSVEKEKATLNGRIEVEAGTSIVSCKFEYGTTTAYGSSVPCSGGGYTANTSVSAPVAGLAPGTDYHYRISATSADGVTRVGEDQEFGPAVVQSESSWGTTGTSSEVRAEIDPVGLATSCRVQYVGEDQFKVSGYKEAASVPCAPASFPASSTTSAASAQLTGLHDETTYHYRFILENSAAPEGAAGSDQTLTTFGVQTFALDAFGGPAEEVDALAGSHPYELTTTVTFPTTTIAKGYQQQKNETAAEANPRDIEVKLPPGLIGNPDAVEKCLPYDVARAECSGASQVGILEVTGSQKAGLGGLTNTTPLYNLVPPKGMPAQFGGRFSTFVTAYINTKVRSGSDYGVTAESLNVSTAEGVTAVTVTMWGVPGDPSHNAERYCPPTSSAGTDEEAPCTEHGPLTPFLRNPTSCTGARPTPVHVDSWQEPEAFVTGGTEMPAITGCGNLKFEPSFEARPTTEAADSASGLNVDLHVPQPEGCKNEGGKVECELAEADLKDAKVTLPAGLAVNPSSADGLESCSEEQVGYLPTKSAEVGEPQFTPEPAQCPGGAKLGTVEVDTPLVEHPLPGGVYLAAQGANPFKSLLALYIAVYDPVTGVVIKLPGKVELNPATGQLTTTFDQDPQLPFEDFKLDFFSSATRAPLTTPLTCGSYSAETDLTPWSTPEGADATPSSKPFEVAGAGGGACVKSEGQAPNSPGFEAGTASPVAAAYSPFVLHLTRDDGSQHFAGLDVTLPPGLSGRIAGVQECPQAGIEAAQARSHEGEGAAEQAHPSCPANSEIGVVHVGTGSGAPYFVTGHAYFAGPYEGAPFSLVFITPAIAGPFDLGTVVVRAALFIDPNTAQVTVKSDPFPTILDGIPLDIRSVNVDVDRGEFTLNPTSCETMNVTGQETSTAGQTANLSDRFQAGGCTTLPFKPSFTAATSSKTSRKDGASIHVDLTYPPGSLGKEANIRYVKVELPKQLPARQETLNHACLAAVFDANPASCPSASRVGSAKALTPILPVPLEGPAYFVSYGGARFPELVMVLQGDGVTIDLHGETFINEKTEVISTTFKSVPDQPVESFELTLPQEEFSALGANGNLCATPLSMPTTFIGQNGAEIKQKTSISVTGCKPTLTILRHSVKRGVLTVTVKAPSAGTLVAFGKGLTRASKTVGKPSAVKVRLRLTPHDRRQLARHHGRRLKVAVTLRFTPKHGQAISGHLSVLMG